MAVTQPAPVTDEADVTEPPRQRRDVAWLYRLGASAFLLASVFSGEGPLGLAFFAAGLGLTAVSLFVRRSIHRYFLWPLSFLLLTLLSGIAVDSIANTDSRANLAITLPRFLQGEGRVFFAYIPLLLPAICRPDERDLNFLVRGFRWVAWLGVIMATIGHLPGLYSMWYAPRTGQLFGFASSHHVSGFLFGTTAIVLLTSHRINRRSNVWLGVAMLAAVVLTGSRSTILGFGVAALVALFAKTSRSLNGSSLRWFRAVSIAAVLLLIPLQTTLRVPILDAELITHLGDLEEAQSRLGTGAYDARTANSIKRFATWTEGIDQFVASPVIGIGAFRYNDVDVEASGIQGVLWLAFEGNRKQTDATAHNAYLHAAIELGVVGLVLLLGTWLSLGRRCSHQRLSRRASAAQRADAEGAMLLVAFALGTGLTSTSLYAPGLCMPVLLFIGSVALRRDPPPRNPPMPALTQVGLPTPPTSADRPGPDAST